MLCGVALLAAFGAGVLIGARQAHAAAPFSLLTDVVAVLEKDFYGTLPPRAARTRAAVQGLLYTLDDSHTYLIEPQPAQQELLQLSGDYSEEDVGVHLWWSTDGQIGLTPYLDGPAAQAGVKAGDYLLSIDGIAVHEANASDNLFTIAQRLRGPEGSPVTLEIARPPHPTATLVITRAPVVRPSIHWRIIRPEAAIAYLRIETVTDQTAQEVSIALSDLRTHGVTRLILDLRNNGGGVLASLPRLLGLFLGEGTVIYRTATRDAEQVTYSTGQAQYQEALVVLVNAQTASAAEIVAAALAEQGRAPLLGAPTYGKGSIQSLYPLRDGSTLHITSAVWLTAQEHPLEGAGLVPALTPDALLPTHNSYPPWVDEMIEAACIYLQGNE